MAVDVEGEAGARSEALGRQIPGLAGARTRADAGRVDPEHDGCLEAGAGVAPGGSPDPATRRCRSLAFARRTSDAPADTSTIDVTVTEIGPASSCGASVGAREPAPRPYSRPIHRSYTSAPRRHTSLHRVIPVRVQTTNTTV